MEASLDTLEKAVPPRFQQMIEAAGDAIYTVDRNGCFSYANPRAGQLLGFAGDDVIGKHFAENVLPTWQEYVRSFYLRQCRDRIAQTKLEFPVFTAEGGEIWIEQITNLIVENDTLIGFQGIARDVTERKLAEQSLLKREHRYRALFEQTNDAVFILDVDGLHVAANHKAAELLADDDAESIANAFREIISPAEAGQTLDVMGTLLAGKSVPVYERNFRKKTGEAFTAEVNVELVRDAVGNPIYILGVVRDITERKLAEATIRQSEINLRRNKERVEAILNSSSDAIIMTYTDGTLQQANPAFARLFGYLPDDVFGQPLSVLVEGGSGELLISGVAAVMESGEARRVEVVARRGDGMGFAADAVLSPIRSDGSKQPTGIVCSLRDISDRKYLEAELRQALENEKEFSALKTRFVSMASHEFRTPLATIQVTCDILSNYIHKMSPEQITARFEKIQAQVKHMALMLDDVLTLGRLQDGRMEFNPVEIEVKDFCNDIVEELRGLHGSHHELAYSHPESTVRARLDKKLMRQTVTNLLTNAIKYSPQGTTVQFALSEEEGWLVMRVTDAGIGIPEEDQKHLFTPFHRAANVGEVSGSGLGLAITKQAVELHGGTIAWQSTVGVGTTFIISFPIVMSDTEEEAYDSNTRD
jgi:PAS domain S-box-containing protein